MEDRLKELAKLLLPWYEAVKRSLPWRQDKEPYHVWLSEIMLQQTRVEAVKGYYARFLEALPTVEALAACEDEKLFKLWEGLGYYSRARNLKKAAKAIVQEHGGQFPGDYASVRALPGIGDYTAGAICSICFDLPTPAVDGNVLRLLSRLLDDHTPIDTPLAKKQANARLAAVYPREAGAFTQALMELGATLCGPNRAPECDRCPCREICLGRQRETVAALPVKGAKKARREEEKTVLILACGGRFAVCKRPEKGLLAGLWQLPELPGMWEAGQVLAELERLGLRPRELRRQTDKKHIFTHVQWNMRGFFLELWEEGGPWQWYSGEDVERELALPTAYRQFWEERSL